MAETSEDERLICVPVGDYSFTKVKEEGYYAFPISYGWTIPKYIAFYRTAPISAITHFGEVNSVAENAKLDQKYKLMTFGDRFEENAILVRFKSIKELKEPVKLIKRTTFQNAQYTTLPKLKKVDMIADL